MTDNHEVFNPDNLTIEPVFKNYKEKQMKNLICLLRETNKFI